MAVIRPITKKLRPSGNMSLLHDSRSDVNSCMEMINECVEKINEIAVAINKIEVINAVD